MATLTMAVLTYLVQQPVDWICLEVLLRLLSGQYISRSAAAPVKWKVH